MTITKHLLNKIGNRVTSDIDAVKEVEVECVVYRKILSHIIDTYIEELRNPVKPFDVDDYGLECAFRNGGAYHLNRIKEVIND